jgi:hypothetical protein
MVYAVLCGRELAGLYSCGVDAHLRCKSVSGRVVQCRLNEDLATPNTDRATGLDSKVVQIDVHEDISRESGFDSYEEWIAARAQTV